MHPTCIWFLAYSRGIASFLYGTIDILLVTLGHYRDSLCRLFGYAATEINSNVFLRPIRPIPGLSGLVLASIANCLPRQDLTQNSNHKPYLELVGSGLGRRLGRRLGRVYR